MLDVPFKRCTATATAPSRAYEFDLGYDLYADHDAEIGPRATAIKTGVAMAIPPGYGGLLMGRSGLGRKQSITPLGFILPGEAGTIRLGGAIDSGYRDEIVVCLAMLGAKSEFPHAVTRGDAIAQIWILPVPSTRLVDVGDGDLPPSERGKRGFASSDGKAFKALYQGEISHDIPPPKRAPKPYGPGSKAREEYEAQSEDRWADDFSSMLDDGFRRVVLPGVEIINPPRPEPSPRGPSGPGTCDPSSGPGDRPTGRVGGPFGGLVEHFDLCIRKSAEEIAGDILLFARPGDMCDSDYRRNLEIARRGPFPQEFPDRPMIPEKGTAVPPIRGRDED